MQTFLGIIIGLFVLTTLVVLHEYGHYRAAIRNGVKVNEFAIGFGPRIAVWLRNPEYTKTKNSKTGSKKVKKWLRIPKEEANHPHDTLVFAINCLPLGGYCAMDGESDADTRKGTFGAASFWAKTKILFAGVAMNWLTAFVILTILAWTGMPAFIDNQFRIESDFHPTYSEITVTEVIENTPAAAAGFQSGDKIISVKSWIDIFIQCIKEPCQTSTTFSTPSDIVSYNNTKRGQKVVYQIERNGETKELTVQLAKDAEYSLGVRMSQSGQTLYRSTWSAPIVGAGTTVQLTVETYKGIAGMFGNLISGIARQFSFDSNTRTAGRAAIGQAGDSVSGPVGIIGVIFPAFTSAGLANLAFLSALISISLACMNVLPIPALDGGRWFLIAFSRLRKKKLEKATEEKIVSRAFIVLIALFVLITILDVIRLF